MANNPSCLPPALDRLRGRLVPFQLCFFAELGSTNDAAAGLLDEESLAIPALVVTDHQTAGRGRRGKGWFSSPGSLAVSFVVPAGNRPPQQLPLLVGLVVREVIAGLVARSPHHGEEQLRQVQVKWPNDVLTEGRKLAGILCERKGAADIIGIGINVGHEPGQVPAELRESMIALRDVGVETDRWEVLGVLAEVMRRHVLEDSQEQSWESVRRQWPAHDALAGSRVEVLTPQGPVTGIAGGIDGRGWLRVITSAGTAVSIASGSVRLIRTP